MCKEFAKFMVESNTATRLLKRITDIGNEAVENIALLIPLPEFPDDTIKIRHPYHLIDTVAIRQIWRAENGEICFHWWGEENGVGVVGRYDAEDCVWLLRSIVDYLAK